MARLSKKVKDNGQLDYFEIDRQMSDYTEKVLLAVASQFRKDRDDNFLTPLARKATRRSVEKAFGIISGKPFIIKDAKVRVDVELISATYNTRLNGGMGYYHISILVKNGKDVESEDLYRIKSTWSSDKKEMFYEAVDNVVDDITELAHNYYNRTWEKLEK